MLGQHLACTRLRGALGTGCIDALIAQWRAVLAPRTGVAAIGEWLKAGNQVVLAIANQFKIPVKYIGVGEKIDDLIIFDKHEFVDSLFKGVTNG